MSAAAPHTGPEPVVRLRKPGGAAARRVLLLHGLAGSTSVWGPFTERAGPSLEVWEAELPWSPAGDTRWSHAVDPSPWVRAALAAVPGGADVLIAHSFAANISLEVLAAGGPELPAAAVLVAPFHRPAPADFDWETLSYYLNGFHRILEEGLRVTAGDRLPPDLVEAMAVRVRDRIGPYGWMRFFDAYLRSPFTDLTALGLPVLVVAGDRDFAAPPDDARAQAGSLADAVLDVFEDCGHFPMAEHPDRFAQAVRSFTAGRPGTTLTDPSRYVRS
ncbi:alpha/beta fold hydrolase [Streptomyces sp. AP-93]|uniref:alpha/beta fold hydrolase n=1 Tax=Streptomyces sp. AP-93 TaxID=2929048 RepID=UPI001FAEA7F1|nr:alpha/beta hydrolase [Streptomyces sp. AP-93]MCJ0871745.1 alpha/beta hydrolase [Streptomyces sp. AP-93]